MQGQEPLNSGRETLRQVREAGREAVREAREAAREAREAARERAKATREAVREAARLAREEANEARTGRPSAEADTRTRIQRVALQLFTEAGYEATSLREIAERLGVTKAALYYHFKTKDEIIDSLVQDRVARIDELIEELTQRPRTAQTRAEFIRRYSELLNQQGHLDVMRFFERNQSSMAHLKSGILMRGKMIEILALLASTDDPLTHQIRCSLAIFALHSSWFVIRDPEIRDDQRQAAALEVALSLIGGNESEARDASRGD